MRPMLPNKKNHIKTYPSFHAPTVVHITMQAQQKLDKG